MNLKHFILTVASVHLLATASHAQRVLPQGIGVSSNYVEGIGMIDATAAGTTLGHPLLRTMAPSIGQLMGLNPTNGSLLTDTNNLMTLAPRALFTDWVQARSSGGDLLFYNYAGSLLLRLGNDGVLSGNGAGLTSLDASQLSSGTVSASRMPAFTGDVTSSAGSTATTVAAVGGKTASAVAASVDVTAAATSANTVATVVKRDASGNFSAGTITGSLSGNATTATTAGNVSGTVAVGNGGTGATSASGALNSLLPTQTGNSGKVLTTDGSSASWSTPGSGGGPTLVLQAFLSSDVSLTPASETQITFNNVIVNAGSAYSSGTFTVPSTGVYIIEYSVTSPTTPSNNKQAFIKKAGSAYFAGGSTSGVAGASYGFVAPMMFIGSLTAGDPITFFVNLPNTSGVIATSGQALIRTHVCIYKW